MIQTQPITIHVQLTKKVDVLIREEFDFSSEKVAKAASNNDSNNNNHDDDDDDNNDNNNNAYDTNSNSIHINSNSSNNYDSHNVI